MKLIKNGNIGTYGGTNYFILPKMYEKNSYDSFLQLNDLIHAFETHFGYMENQTIHIFASFDWISLIDMMKPLTPEQFTTLYDNILDKYAELRHFHNVQNFLSTLIVRDGFLFYYNRIVFHCNTDKEILRNISPKKYIFNRCEISPVTVEEYETFKNMFSKLRLQGYPCGGYTLFKPNENTSIEVGFKYKDGKMMPDVIINGKSLEEES